MGDNSAARANQSAMINAGRSFSGHERNSCFLNTGASPNAGGRFADISAVSGLDFDDDARAVAMMDWDHDGDLDLWISNRNAPRLRFLRNDHPSPTKHWVGLKLVGDGKTCNRDAIGGRVELILRTAEGGPSRRSIRTLRAGEGFLSQSSKWIHFAFGPGETIDEVVVRWPDKEGRRETFTGITGGSRYLLRQGSGKPEAARRRAKKPDLTASPPATLPPSRTARIPLVTLFPRPRLNLSDLSGSRIDLETGKPVLLNVWASWCAPCLAELTEFVNEEDAILQAGLQVVALSVDGHGDGNSNPQSTARSALQKIAWPFPSAMATEEQLNTLQSHHNALIALNRPLPVPSSFLFDAQGRLAVIYKGPVTVKTVLADLSHTAGTREERWIRAAPVPGTTIDHEAVRMTADSIESIVHFRNGLARERAKEFSAALYHHGAAVSHRPKFAAAHRKIGNLSLRNKNWSVAAKHYELAIAAEPDDPATHFALGDTYRKMSEPDKAAREYREVLRINPKHLQTRVKLADVLFEGGHRNEALETARDALSMARAAKNEQLVRLLETRIRGYQQP